MSEEKKYRVEWTHKKTGVVGHSREMTKKWAEEFVETWNKDNSKWRHRVVDAE